MAQKRRLSKVQIEQSEIAGRRARSIIDLHDNAKLTYRFIGEIMGITGTRAAQIVARYRNKLERAANG